MMKPCLTILVFALLLVFASRAVADEGSPADAAPRLFAVEIRVGPNWDTAKAPGEQAFFKEHSANLKRLRDDGHIVMGARYSDIGLIVIAASSDDAVRSMMQKDPSIAAGTFVFEVHEFRVFYPGFVEAR